jgi:hypothetical protein
MDTAFDGQYYGIQPSMLEHVSWHEVFGRGVTSEGDAGRNTV